MKGNAALVLPATFVARYFAATREGFPLNTIREFPRFLLISNIYNETRYNTNQRVLHRYEKTSMQKGPLCLSVNLSVSAPYAKQEASPKPPACCT